MQYKYTLTTSTADWLIAIIAAVIAALTFILNSISPTNPEISITIIVGAIVAFLTAIISRIPLPAPTPPAPTPTPAP